jgi:hypothetical protein
MVSMALRLTDDDSSQNIKAHEAQKYGDRVLVRENPETLPSHLAVIDRL